MADASRLSVCLTFDFDATSVWIVDTDNPAAISRGEFGPVAIPRILALFDVGWSTEQSPPSVVREIWQAEFDYAHANAPGGVFGLCMHPQVIGRGSRLMMLDGLLDHMAAQPGVVFETCGAYAERWRMAHPLDEWRRTPSVHAPRRPASPSQRPAT